MQFKSLKVPHYYITNIAAKIRRPATTTTNRPATTHHQLRPNRLIHLIADKGIGSGSISWRSSLSVGSSGSGSMSFCSCVILELVVVGLVGDDVKVKSGLSSSYESMAVIHHRPVWKPSSLSSVVGNGFSTIEHSRIRKLKK
ncbi:hypothetical protein RB653_004489 [Dictyostelium firmibasis]|uniref:Uncharacterized protein n=1 Tax=Dictyostelium firmibasis TaxID=79012 RepID=A0AAN7UAM0_9MYCE